MPVKLRAGYKFCARGGCARRTYSASPGGLCCRCRKGHEAAGAVIVRAGAVARAFAGDPRREARIEKYTQRAALRLPLFS